MAHVRYLLDLEVASGTYGFDVGNMRPLELIATLFNFEISNEEGGGAGVISRIAQRSASWLTRKAVQFSCLWSNPEP